MLDLVAEVVKAVEASKNSNKKSLEYMVLDSVIIAFIALVAVFPANLPDINTCWIMVKAFLAAFIVQFAVERGIKK